MLESIEHRVYGRIVNLMVIDNYYRLRYYYRFSYPALIHVLFYHWQACFLGITD